MKEIVTQKGERIKVDDNTYEQVKDFHWHLNTTGYPVTKTFNGPTYFLHHYVLPQKENYVIDHIDRDKTNCQASNLRYATRSQNNANGSIYKNNTSGYRGVHYIKGRDKNWRAGVRVNKKLIVSKRCFTQEEAALAYNELAIKYFGEFANLNVIKT